MLDDFTPDGVDTDDEAELRGPAGRWLMFLRVPGAEDDQEPDAPRPAAGRLAAGTTVQRLLWLGARMVDGLRDG